MASREDVRERAHPFELRWCVDENDGVECYVEDDADLVAFCEVGPGFGWVGFMCDGGQGVGPFGQGWEVKEL